MTRFIAMLRNIAEPGLREVREIDIWQPGNVRQGRTHHGANHSPSCRYAVVRKVIQQVGDAYVMGPLAHFYQIVVKRQIEGAPTQFQIQADNNCRLRHLLSSCSDAATREDEADCSPIRVERAEVSFNFW